MWHQEVSSSPVSSTMSASRPAGARFVTVMSAVVAPPARATSSARIVAHVAPSWLTPITSAGPLASTDVDARLERLDGPRRGGPTERPAEDRSDRPRAMLARPAADGDDRVAGRAMLQHRVGEPRRAAVSSQPFEDPRGQRRLGLDHLRHVPRRPVATGRHVRLGPGIGRAGKRCIGVQAAVVGRGVVGRGLVGGQAAAPSIDRPAIRPNRFSGA